MADGGHDRHGARRDRAHEPLVRERQQVLERAAAACEHEHVDAARAEILDRGRHGDRCARALHVRLRDDDVCGREARRDRGQHVALGGCVVARHKPDQARDPRQRPLALRCEQSLRGELLLQPLQRGEVLAEPEALDRERPQAELAAKLPELGPAVDMDALAVRQIEP